MGKRILIVDDSRTTLEILKIYLMGHEYDYELASDGVTALELARKNRPDLIVSDIAMPKMTGLQLCAAIRNTPGLLGVPILLVTSKKDDDTRRAAFSAGASGLLTKPVDADRLAQLVQQLLSEKG